MAVCALTSHLGLSTSRVMIALPTIQDTGWHSAVPRSLVPKGSSGLEENQPGCPGLALRGFPLLSGLKSRGTQFCPAASLRSGEEEVGPVWLPFPLPSVGSCESASFGGGMRLNAALDTVPLGLSSEAMEEQEGGWRKKRGKWAADPNCASPCCAHSSWKPAKSGS